MFLRNMVVRAESPVHKGKGALQDPLVPSEAVCKVCQDRLHQEPPAPDRPALGLKVLGWRMKK